ncbi:Y-family DNA polymerase [Chitinimonas naiadis]
MLWLALYLPNLPLDALHLSATPTQPEPWAVLEQRGANEHVVTVNAAAWQLGIRPGQRRSTAQALAAGLRLARRQPAQEAAMLDNLANWAMQFTPTVCLVPPAGLLLEIEGSLTYFKGLPRLCRLIDEGLADMQIAVRRALAPTPQAASWFAQLGLKQTDGSLDHWQQSLQRVPLARLPWPREWQQAMRSLGLRRLGELLALPREGLGRRFGPNLALLLDRAQGLIPDPRQPFLPADQFLRTVELQWPCEHIEALGFVMKRLLVELAAFLLGRGLGVQQLVLRLQHDGSEPSEVKIGFGKPTRSADGMLAISRERLAQLVLPAPVEAMSLIADNLHRLDGEALGLFGNATANADFDLLLARLAARLGNDAVRQLACVEDHRPEQAWHIAPAESKSPDLPAGQRPAWLLAEPLRLEMRDQRPWYGEPLTLLARAERIETGWWDGASVARDYFRAEGPSGRRYWLYQQRNDLAWYLHGLYA